MSVPIVTLSVEAASLEASVTVSPVTGKPSSVTVTLAVLVEVPFATIADGVSATVTVRAAGQVTSDVYVLVFEDTVVQPDCVPP